MPDRLKSLDVLRGLNMFFLTVFTAWMVEFCYLVPGLDWLQPQWHHNPFGSTTLTLHDWIMPLFLFCSGTAIPFAFAKYEAQGRTKAQMYWRILRRVAALWFLGMICQGNLLKYDFAQLKWFSNTLQSIAVGYAFSAIFYMNFKPRTQVLIAGALLLAYWALMMFVRTRDGFGGGDFGQHNLCEWVDRTVLGRHCDHATLNPDGSYYFKKAGYTWLLSSLNFIVTVMTGTFAGEILKGGKGSGRGAEQGSIQGAEQGSGRGAAGAMTSVAPSTPSETPVTPAKTPATPSTPGDAPAAPTGASPRKALTLIGLGAAMFAAGKLWGFQMPVNKYIWTSTMTLVTSGIGFMLLGVIYWIVDCRKWRGLDWLLPFGLNAIFIYFIGFICDFHTITKHLVDGLKPIISNPHWFGLIRCTVHGLLVWGLLYLMMKKKIFLRV